MSCAPDLLKIINILVGGRVESEKEGGSFWLMCVCVYVCACTCVCNICVCMCVCGGVVFNKCYQAGKPHLEAGFWMGSTFKSLASMSIKKSSHLSYDSVTE